MAYTIFNGDCRDVMAAMEENSIDSIVSDPPYGLDFMGRNWDHGVPDESFWKEALRIAKPGAYLLAFGGTRTYHRLAVAIEDAGWEIRDCLGWLYGSGFPKSMDISKAIDKAAGLERPDREVSDYGTNNVLSQTITVVNAGTPVHPAALKYQGWGTCLKPAWEPIVMARKPIKGTVANNVIQYGTGGINLDASRVPSDESWSGNSNPDAKDGVTWGGSLNQLSSPSNPIGRFPANIIHDGSEEATAPIGEAARFFYCAKASKSDRDEGLEALEALEPQDGGVGAFRDGGRKTTSPRLNIHPTVKPTSLMEYLVRMVTPEGGVTLDPFMGSGSTLKAATRAGFDCIGIDLSEDYCAIAEGRVAHEAAKGKPVVAEPKAAPKAYASNAPTQEQLF